MPKESLLLELDTDMGTFKNVDGARVGASGQTVLPAPIFAGIRRPCIWRQLFNAVRLMAARPGMRRKMPARGLRPGQAQIGKHAYNKYLAP